MVEKLDKKEALAKELGKCAGKWVATDDDHFIACGTTIEEVEKKLEAAHTKNPIIFRVPDVSKGHYFF